MNQTEKQILKNQLVIMDGSYSNCDKEIEETKELLNPKSKDESACDMSDLDEMDAEEDALLDVNGGKKEK